MGHYRVVRRLACGGMAEVLLGKVVGAGGFEKPVAIKRMLPAIAEDPQSAEAFLREARLCVHLVHPHVVQVLDLGTSQGQPYLVMELVDGEDLRQVIEAGREHAAPLRPHEAMHIAACVAEALAYAHDAPGPSGAPLRVVHRDVNPCNVLISMRGEVKLADFGVAKAADGREATQGNMVKGKLQYLAPELLRGVAAGHASDIFLTGALLFELVAGRALFAADGSLGNLVAAISAHDERRLPLPPGLPPELLAILRRALARDPAARYAHARELAAELRQVIEEHRWRVTQENLALRMADLFPGRAPLDRDLGEGVPLHDDLAAPRPPARSPAPGPTRGTPLGQLAAKRAAPAKEGSPAHAEPLHQRLGKLMVESGLITLAQLEMVLARQRQEGGRIGEWVVRLGLAPARSVLALLARQLGVPFVTDEKLLEAEPPPEALARLPLERALELLALPLSAREGRIYVAMADPVDAAKVGAVRFHLGGRVRTVVATELGLRQAIAKAYRVFGGEGHRPPFPATPPSFSVAYPGGGAPPFTPVPAAVYAPGYGPAAATPAAGFPVAYVHAGVGPDGQPLFMAVPMVPVSTPLTPQPLPLAAHGWAGPPFTPQPGMMLGAPAASGPAPAPPPRALERTPAAVRVQPEPARDEGAPAGGPQPQDRPESPSIPTGGRAAGGSRTGS